MTLLFPQLSTGAIAQFPVGKEYLPATAINTQEDGTHYRYGDPDPIRVSWSLRYNHLTAGETSVLEAFFGATLGPVLPFTFLDPLTNLLAWSEDFTNPIWQASPLLGLSSFAADGIVAHSFSGSGTATQILQCTQAATLCLSVIARADQPARMSLTVADQTNQFDIGTLWRQYFVTRTGSGDSSTTDAAITASGNSLQIAKVMVSAQPAPGSYVSTRDLAGVMPNTRFDQDRLVIKAEGVNDFACDVRLTSNLD